MALSMIFDLLQECLTPHFTDMFIVVLMQVIPSLGKFPLTLSELVNSAKDFCSISSHGITNGCVAALDGWLCCTWVPSANELT
jgi:hypothetical protein